MMAVVCADIIIFIFAESTAQDHDAACWPGFRAKLHVLLRRRSDSANWRSSGSSSTVEKPEEDRRTQTFLGGEVGAAWEARSLRNWRAPLHPHAAQAAAAPALLPRLSSGQLLQRHDLRQHDA